MMQKVHCNKFKFTTGISKSRLQRVFMKIMITSIVLAHTMHVGIHAYVEYEKIKEIISCPATNPVGNLVFCRWGFSIKIQLKLNIKFLELS